MEVYIVTKMVYPRGYFSHPYSKVIDVYTSKKMAKDFVKSKKNYHLYTITTKRLI